MTTFENITMNTVNRENLIFYGDTIVVGVSGGADSVSLLYFLTTIREKYNLTIKACHVNHNIRNETAKRDELFVKNLCEKLNVEFFLKSEKIPALAEEWKMTEEEAGRKVRYDFFNEIAGATGKIATAHNQNDNVETLLMRLIRGTGLSGLSGIKYKRDNIIRPILDVPRSEIENYIHKNNLDYVTDETNLENEYTRNKIRLDLIPFICDNFNPNFKNTLASNIPSFVEDSDFIEKEAEKEYRICVSEKFEIDLEHFSGLHASIQKRILIKALRSFSQDCQMSTPPALLEKVCNFENEADGFAITFCKDIIVKKINGKIKIYKKSEKAVKETISIYDILDVDEYKMDDITIHAEIIESTMITSNANCCHIPLEKIKNLVFRTCIDGDRFIVDNTMKQKLKKIYYSNNIENDRNKYILATPEGIVWIPGVQSTRLENRKGKFLKLEII